MSVRKGGCSMDITQYKIMQYDVMWYVTHDALSGWCTCQGPLSLSNQQYYQLVSSLPSNYYCLTAIHGCFQFWKRQSTALAQGDAFAKFNGFLSNTFTSKHGFTCFNRFCRFATPNSSVNPRQTLILPLILPTFGSFGLYVAHFLFSDDWWKVICTPLDDLFSRHAWLHTAMFGNHTSVTHRQERGIQLEEQNITWLISYGIHV